MSQFPTQLSSSEVINQNTGSNPIPVSIYFDNPTAVPKNYGVAGVVNASVRDNNGNVYLGGYFNHVVEGGHVGLTAIDLEGLNCNLNIGLFDDYVYKVIKVGSSFFAVGGFRNYAGTPCQGIAKFDLNWNLDTNFDSSSGVPTGSYIGCVAASNDGYLFLGGGFSSYAGYVRKNLVKINATTGAVDTSFDTSSGFNAGVYDVLFYASTNDIFVAGDFTLYGSTVRQRIAKLNASTAALNLTFDSTVGFNSNVFELALHGSGIFAGGQFDTYKGLAYKGLVKIDLITAAIDTTFNSLSAFDTGNLISIDVSGDYVYAAGYFNTYKGVARKGVVKINALNADLDTTFDTSSLEVFETTAVAVKAVGGSVYLLGSGQGSLFKPPFFYKLDSTTAASNTSFYNKWYAATSTNTGFVCWDFLVDADKIYVNGFVGLQINGIARKNIVKFNANGALDLAFDPGASFNSTVLSLSLSADGTFLYVGGIFTNYKNFSVNRLAKISTLDAGIDPGFSAGANGGIQVLSPALSDTRIFSQGLKTDLNYPATFISNNFGLFSYGNNSFGQLGDSTTLDRSSPVSVVGGVQFKQVAVGQGTVCGLDNNGLAWAWGRNNRGALGNNSGASASSPTSVVGGKIFKKIIRGGVGNTFFGLDASGYLWSWGEGNFGIIGNGSTSDRSSPASVLGGRNWLEVVSNNYSVFGLDASGYVWTWGINNAGQLGNNTTSNASSPVSVVGARQFKQLRNSGNYILGLDKSYFLWGWGSNSVGQLGANTTTAASSPLSVVGGKQFLDFDTASFAAVALDFSGYAWGWGQNLQGQLADGTTQVRSSPVSVIGARQFSKIHGALDSNQDACFFAATFADYLWAWGSNRSSQLGDGSTTSKSSPISVLLNQITKFSPSPSPAAIVGSSVFSWGTNIFGSAGDNTSSSRSSPVSVVKSFSFGPMERTNDLYLGGSFTGLSNTSNQFGVVCLDQISGSNIPFDLGKFANATGTLSIRKIFKTTVNSFYVAGSFTHFDGVSRNGLAKFNHSGKLDLNFDTSVGFANGTLSGSVFDFVISTSGSDLFAVGRFDSYNSSAAGGVVKLNAYTGQIDPTFDSSVGTIRSGVAYDVNAVVFADSEAAIVIGGNFVRYNSLVCLNLVKLDVITGTVVNNNLYCDQTINSLASGFSSIYAAGSFTQVFAGGNVNASVLDFTTAADLGLKFGKFDGAVHALYTDGSSIFACGEFTAYNGIARQRIAKFDLSGNLDLTFDTATGFNSTVRSLTVVSGDLYAVGLFSQYKSLSCQGIAKLNSATGALDTSFVSGLGYADIVYTVAVSADSLSLYIGGSFTTYGGTARQRICKINRFNGTLDSTFNSSSGFNSDVRSIILSGSDLWVGGYFSSYGASGRQYVAKLNSTTAALDATFNSASGFNNPVLTLEYDGTNLYVGGGFSSYKGTARQRIAKLNATTAALDATFDTASGLNADCHHILFSGGNLYVSGFFTTYKSVLAEYLVKIDALNASRVGAFNTGGAGGRGFNSPANGSILIGSNLYVYGSFSGYKYQIRQRICKFDENLIIDATFDSSSGANSYVRSVFFDGDVYIGGGFSAYGGVTRQRLAKISPVTAALDLTFDTASGFNSDVYSLSSEILVPGSGSIFALGSFSTYKGVNAGRIAKLNKTTAAPDLTFTAGNGFNGNTLCSSVDGGVGNIYVGGEFGMYNPTTYNQLGKINVETNEIDSIFTPDANSTIYSITPTVSGGALYIGGDFTTYKGTTRQRFARIGAASANLDVTFNTSSGFNNRVRTSLANPGLFVAGDFTAYAGTTRQRIAKLNPVDATLDAIFDTASGFDNSVYALILGQSSGNPLYVGGSFSNYKSYPRAAFVELNSTTGVDITKPVPIWKKLSDSTYLVNFHSAGVAPYFNNSFDYGLLAIFSHTNTGEFSGISDRLTFAYLNPNISDSIFVSPVFRPLQLISGFIGLKLLNVEYGGNLVTLYFEPTAKMGDKVSVRIPADIIFDAEANGNYQSLLNFYYSLAVKLVEDSNPSLNYYKVSLREI